MNMNEMLGPLEETSQQDIKSCRICKKEKLFTEFVKNKVFKSGIDNICLFCSREKVKAWRLSGKRDSKKERERRLEKYGESLKEAERLQAKNRRNKIQKVLRPLKTKEELKATKNKCNIKRRAREKNVAWDLELTNFVCKEAAHLVQLRKQTTGFSWHVDHIVPLCGKNVSGLHVWNNLQVIPAEVNIRKNNGFTTE